MSSLTIQLETNVDGRIEYNPGHVLKGNENLH
jgi:hypothetical protein